MGTINTGSFAKALWPGVNKFYSDAYNEYPIEFTMLFDKETSTKAYEEDVGVMGFGLADVTGQGEGVLYDTASQTYTNRYIHLKYTKGFIITEEAMDDAQYDVSVLGRKDAKALAFSMRQTKEIVAANIYNRFTTAGYTYGDGVVLGSAAHPLFGGGTFSNMPAVACDLSEAALEQAVIDIAGFVNDRGLKVAILPKTLIIPKELIFEAERILKSVLQSDSADNNINALRNLNMFPGGAKASHYLTDPDAWFIRTNCPDGMKYFERKADSFAMDNDFDTANAKFKASARYSFGNTDPRGIYGSVGA
jgi:hypothetical protein